jgi:tripartite-type tricarboxylate transporter receptor subunit TctC
LKTGVALAFVMCGLIVSPADSQTFPARPIRLVVGQATGGHSDVIARTLAQRMSETLKQPIIVENRGGAAGTIAAEAVARAPADGYTLLLSASSNLGLGLLVTKDLRYSVADFASVGGIARVTYGIAVHTSIPVTNLAGFADHARKHPGMINYATSGPASMSALGFDKLKRAANLDMVAVAYKGSGAAVSDFMSGHVHAMFTDFAMLTNLAASGNVRLLAVASSVRSPLAPHIATVGEQGFAELAIEPWYGLAVPAATPSPVIGRLNAALREALHSTEVRAQFERLGYTVFDSTPADLDATIEREAKFFQPLAEPDGRLMR